MANSSKWEHDRGYRHWFAGDHVATVWSTAAGWNWKVTDSRDVHGIALRTGQPDRLNDALKQARAALDEIGAGK